MTRRAVLGRLIAMTSISGTPARACATATAVLALDTVLWALHLAVRPPCPDGYVRLVDIGGAVPFGTGFLALLAGGLRAASRSNHSQRLGVEGRIAVGLSVLGLVLLVAAIGVLLGDGQQSVATNCWTF